MLLILRYHVHKEDFSFHSSVPVSRIILCTHPSGSQILKHRSETCSSETDTHPSLNPIKADLGPSWT